ncbi:MAG TPA: DUF1043 family protein [Gammaproteobacteria bacterium]|nr:DUF1043 family protein [Gammaproteobacteria bacterium]
MLLCRILSSTISDKKSTGLLRSYQHWHSLSTYGPSLYTKLWRPDCTVTITTPILIGSLVLACLVGILLGYLVAGNKRDSRKDRARIAELESSLQEYKDQVQQHFSTTASLFQDLGHNYRNLYNYMAESANALCPEIPDTAALQFDATDLLPEQEQATVEETTQVASAAAVADSPQSEQKPATPTDDPAVADKNSNAATPQVESDTITAPATPSAAVNTAPTQNETDTQDPETPQTAGVVQAKISNP